MNTMTTANRVPILVREDLLQDGYGMVRDDKSPPAVVAVMHDGTEAGHRDAKRLGEIIRRALANDATSDLGAA